MEVIMLIGRVLFGIVFITSGLAHFAKTDAMVGYAQFKKVPAAKPAVLLSGLLLILGSASVILGVVADLGALVLAVLTLVMALKMHDFWAQSDAQAKQTETISFWKNISMSGAALFIFAVAATEGSNIGWTLTESLWSL
jgi:putative oxidoreductase